MSERIHYLENSIVVDTRFQVRAPPFVSVVSVCGAVPAQVSHYNTVTWSINMLLLPSVLSQHRAEPLPSVHVNRCCIKHTSRSLSSTTRQLSVCARKCCFFVCVCLLAERSRSTSAVILIWIIKVNNFLLILFVYAAAWMLVHHKCLVDEVAIDRPNRFALIEANTLMSGASQNWFLNRTHYYKFIIIAANNNHNMDWYLVGSWHSRCIQPILNTYSEQCDAFATNFASTTSKPKRSAEFSVDFYYS